MTTLIDGTIYSVSSNSPMKLTIQYEYQRSGADMQYRFYYHLWLSNSSSWYSNNLRLKMYLNGSEVYSVDNRSYDKGWSFSNTTGWFTVSNKTSGTVPFYVSVSDTQNSSWCQYTSGTYSLTVAPAYTSITKFDLSKKVVLLD